ncbi:MAG: hypothetical protein ACRDAU_05185 [Clostridium sp.]
MINYFLMPYPSNLISEISSNPKTILPKTFTAFEKVFNDIAKLNPETIVLISPCNKSFNNSFYIYSESFIHGNLNATSFSPIKYEIDLELTKLIVDTCKNFNILINHMCTKTASLSNIPLNLDSNSCIPLYFHKNRKATKLVYLTYSFLSKLDHLNFGNAIKAALINSSKNIVVIHNEPFLFRRKRHPI